MADAIMPDSPPHVTGEIDTHKAAERGITVADLIVELIAVHPKPAGLDGFVGCMDSGAPDWAGTDTEVLRKRAAARTQLSCSRAAGR